MNCEDFNKIVHELADYKPMQVTLRDAGVSHVALCAECATKLASARTLSTSLVVAAGAESEQAPVRIKEDLLAAFAALQHESAKPRGIEEGEIAEVSTVEASVVAMSLGHKRRWLTAAGVAVSALAAVILLAVVLPHWRNASAPESLPPASDLKAGIEPPRTPNVIVDKAIPSYANEKSGATVKSGPGKRRVSIRRRPEAGNATQTYQTVAQNTGEYLPLTYLAKSTAIDSGTIVRVELSRSALASLGLRMNFEGTGASVKADVVIGDDGVAQAIRLVQ